MYIHVYKPLSIHFFVILSQINERLNRPLSPINMADYLTLFVFAQQTVFNILFDGNYSLKKRIQKRILIYQSKHRRPPYANFLSIPKLFILDSFFLYSDGTGGYQTVCIFWADTGVNED